MGIARAIAEASLVQDGDRWLFIAGPRLSLIVPAEIGEKIVRAHTRVLYMALALGPAACLYALAGCLSRGFEHFMGSPLGSAGLFVCGFLPCAWMNLSWGLTIRRLERRWKGEPNGVVFRRACSKLGSRAAWKDLVLTLGLLATCYAVIASRDTFAAGVVMLLGLPLLVFKAAILATAYRHRESVA